LLLAQPVSRARLWLEKMMVLAVLLVAASGVVMWAVWLWERDVFDRSVYLWIETALIPLIIFTTAPFWSLIYRNTLVGGIISLVVPCLIWGLNSFVHQRWLGDRSSEITTGLVLIAGYGLVCLWGGYWRFGTLQLIDGSARELRLPERWESLLLRPLRLATSRLVGPVSSLVRKELRIQQLSFLIALLFVLVAVATAVLDQLLPNSRYGFVDTLLIASLFLYVAILPLIVGALSVAEEKGWGVSDWQLTLPVAARKQWGIKLAVALGVSALLGMVLPTLVGLAIEVILASKGTVFSGFGKNLRASLGEAGTQASGVFVVLLQMSVTSVAIYAGSICRNSARAMVLALGMMVATGFLISAGYSTAMFGREFLVGVAEAAAPPFHMSLFFALLGFGLAVLLGMFLWMGYGCYRNREPRARLLKSQAAVLIVFVFLGTIFFVTFSGLIYGP
jgi:hypothetical protein